MSILHIHLLQAKRGSTKVEQAFYSLHKKKWNRHSFGSNNGFDGPKAMKHGKPIAKNQCRYCEKFGHYAVECRKRKADLAKKEEKKVEEVNFVEEVITSMTYICMDLRIPRRKRPEEGYVLKEKPDFCFNKRGISRRSQVSISAIKSQVEIRSSWSWAEECTLKLRLESGKPALNLAEENVDAGGATAYRGWFS
ncbi:hypothetical protein R1flu_027221 [Riccia fluitans]|uniref:CCHC-type domain-containing protein n=1 Tax=Riccia fluitans TaxID=41844 RepID=A0ABD1XI58_9MARC